MLLFIIALPMVGLPVMASAAVAAFSVAPNQQHLVSTLSVVASNNLSNNGRSTPSTILSSPSSFKHAIHLISLPPKDDKYKLPGEALVRECWRWKDSTLGDGRDYFVPRPRALQAFQSLFLGMEIDVISGVAGSPVDVRLSMPSSSSSKSTISLSTTTTNVDLFLPDNHASCSFSFKVVECVTLSNCARFETILVLEEQQRLDTLDVDPNITLVFSDIAGKHAVAYRLLQQMSSQRSKGTSLLQKTGLTSWLDLPGAVDVDLDNNLSDKQLSETNQLAQRLTSIEGAFNISSHLSLIAAGLAPRPNRPDRDVIFRPYSSRDAHILLQLKRTVEVVSVVNRGGGEIVDGKRKKNSRGRIKTLLDGALSAGKAARNEDIVPNIKQLKEYGSDGTPPKVLADEVAKAAIELAIQPSVDSCLARLIAMETADDITQFRKRVNEIATSLGQEAKDTSRLLKMANELLHEPTIQLRKGRLSNDDIESVIKHIEDELRAYADNRV